VELLSDDAPDDASTADPSGPQREIARNRHRQRRDDRICCQFMSSAIAVRSPHLVVKGCGADKADPLAGFPTAIGITAMQSFISKCRRRFARSRFERSLEWVHGPSSIGAHPEAMVVVCLVRDGARYLPEFFRHYRNLGAERFAFVDNGSKDGTLDILSEQPDVSLFRSDMLYRDCKIAAKQFLTESFGQGNWVLLADIDEFFQFPLCEDSSLRTFLKYLNRYDFGTVTCQMLDMFPSGPLRNTVKEADSGGQGPSLDGTDGGSFIHQHRFYSLSGLRSVPYTEGPCKRFGNIVEFVGVRNYYGGIRYRKFNSDNFLSKHPLLCPAKGVKLVNCHAVASARVADLTGVLLHFKYVDGFYEYCKQIAAEGSFHKNSAAYKAFEKALVKRPELALFDETARTYVSTSQLIDQGLLVVSDRYRKFLA